MSFHNCFIVICKMMSSTANPSSGFELVKNSTDLERGSSVRIAKEISWSNIQYKVGEKKILSDCWGKVKALRLVF